MEQLAAIAGILIGVWIIRTALPYFIKHWGTGFDLKFVLTGLVSTFIMVAAVVADEVAIYAIPEGISPLWVFIGALIASSGLSDILNRYGITAWRRPEPEEEGT